MPPWDQLWIDANLATMRDGDPQVGEIRDAALAAAGESIVWVGAMRHLPGAPGDLARRVTSVAGRWITPGLIDCHTHLVFGGQRAAEFQARLAGASYEAIARAGGGIVSTVEATRIANESTLTDSAAARLRRLHAEGVTTVEIKSGYGLDTETELRMLRVGKRLATMFPVSIRTTFLGAHAVPRAFTGRAEAYVDLVCMEMLPKVVDAGLADAVDVFCERIAFTPAQTSRIFEVAQAHGLPVKLHADQLSDSGGAALAARFRALSADHLEYAADDGIAMMAEAGTTAVLLPGAWYFTNEAKRPPVEAFRAHHVPMAVATDCNPGSSPTISLLLMLNMACTLFGLTTDEALAGVTRHAARALGLQEVVGTLEVGRRADLAIWDITEPAELCYWLGANPCVDVVCAGHSGTR